MKKEKQVIVPAPLRPMRFFLLVSVFSVGLFYEVLSCAASLFLLGYLLYCARKRGALVIPRGLTLPAVAAVAAFYALSALWAVDRGMALLGFVKFLPLPLFCLAAAQLDKAERQSLLDTFPPAGAVMTLVAWPLGQIPALREYFIIDGRLAGFFQYPNVYGLFLLLGVIILLSRRKWNIWRGLCLAVLLVGIFLSGSRTVFVLLVAVAVVYIVCAKDKLTRWLLLGLLLALVAGTVIYTAVTGNASAMSRYLTSSLSASSLVGRLLYFRDVLPVIARHPFGLGYMGYYFTQGSFQTGVYTVLNVHNELLQLLLDVGWLPAIAVTAALVRAVLPGRNTMEGRMIILAIAAHSMLDFDLQFVAIGFSLILAMDLENVWAKAVPVKKPVIAAAGALGCLCLYFGLATGLYSAHAYKAAASVYPGYTSAWMKLLPQAEDAAEMDTLADKILARNQSCALAYSAKARAAYAGGDFGGMIEYKEQAISLAKYSLEEYLDYFDMLAVGVRLYTAAGDEASAEYCRQRLLAIPEMLARVEEGTSSLGRKIDDQPNLTLPETYRQTLAELEGR